VQVQLFPSLSFLSGERGQGPGRRRLQRAARPGIAADGGYALIDALVGLLIIAMGLIFSLEAGQQARAAADQALEVRHAQTLLTQLIETGPRGFDDAAGATDAFAWQIETRATGGERPIEVCHRQVTLTNVRSKRTYQAATLETCPIEATG
jgi:hypothetical protein